uniref:Fucosyltransferase n=1 Tax=Ornithorhynchus anatinus TaxID=9258 RepID=F7F5S0_ORNAN
MPSGRLLVKGLLGGVVLLTLAFWNLKFWLPLPEGVPRPRQPQAGLTVLIWHWPFGRPANLSGDVCATLYGVEGCLLTTNRSLLRQADVVVFHHRELQSGQARLPLGERPPHQPWLWITLESPSHTYGLARLGGIFNWVMTYRRDSDVFMPYGELVPRASPAPTLPPKDGLVSWVVSNYHAGQRRAAVYAELAKHVPVALFGRANGRPLCPACLVSTTGRYRFYLAFENSQHHDYITEKLWRNALLAGAVPVVLGPPRATYEAFLPPDAFIHVDDFGSVRELARFLSGMNASCYQLFFRWRERLAVRLHADWRERFCTICSRYPHLPRGRVYRDLEAWFRGGDGPQGEGPGGAGGGGGGGEVPQVPRGGTQEGF